MTGCFFLDKKGQQKTFNNLMELYVLPEITRRKERGVLPKNFVLMAAQILFPDGMVRLNEEARIHSTVKLKKDVKANKGEFIPLSNYLNPMHKNI